MRSQFGSKLIFFFLLSFSLFSCGRAEPDPVVVLVNCEDENSTSLEPKEEEDSEEATLKKETSSTQSDLCDGFEDSPEGDIGDIIDSNLEETQENEDVAILEKLFLNNHDKKIVSLKRANAPEKIFLSNGNKFLKIN